MKRLKKAVLLPVRNLAYRWKRLRLYYWADERLYELRAINVMPSVYYRLVYQLSMSLIGFNRFRRIADWAIHTIPYNVRFNMA